MPRGFEYPIYPGDQPQMWKPQNWTAEERAIRDNQHFCPGLSVNRAFIPLEHTLENSIDASFVKP